MSCGHPKSLVVRSVESDAEVCELCDTRQRRNDAEAMELRYRQQRDALRLALIDLAVAVNAMPESDRFGATASLERARVVIAEVSR